MPKNPNPWAVASRATKAMQAIASMGGWPLTMLGTCVPPAFAHHTYVSSANLVILPTAKPMADAMATMNAVMAVTRANGLIVQVGDDEDAELQVELGFCIFGSKERRWFVPMSLWMPADEALWIVPDPYHAVRPECFQVTDGHLVPGRAPWRSAVDHLHGLVRADAWMDPFIR